MNKIILCGNANTGKTTTFNMLTKSFEKVGNFHGVTTDKKIKKITLNNKDYIVVDLPGIYSLNTYTLEEKIAVDYLCKNVTNNDVILYMVDIGKIRRNLYLFWQLKELGYKIIICINNIDDCKFNINYKKLSRELNCEIIIFSKKIKQDLCKVIENKNEYFIPQFLKELVKNLEYKNMEIKQKFDCVRYLENGEKMTDNYGKLPKLQQGEVVLMRYNYIENNLKNCNYSVKTNKNNFLDKIVTNNFSGLLFFVCIVCLVFYIVFGLIGSVNDFLQEINYKIFDLIRRFLLSQNLNIFLVRFVTEGLYFGISILITFLPQLFALFLCFSIIEESGYISRLCFLADDFLSKFGLNGKSIFTILMCFGCSTSGCYQSRTNKDKNSKIKVAMITPFISCSAKIPIYLLLLNTFYKDFNIMILMLIYLLGILIALLGLKILDVLLESKKEDFILEMPKLKMPKLKNIIFSSTRQTRDFFIKIGSLIMVFNCIVWILINCNFKLLLVEDLTQSIMFNVAKMITPIFAPLGFGVCIVSSLLCGVLSKEIIISTLTMFTVSMGITLQQGLTTIGSGMYLTKSTALGFLVFVLFYCPCISNYIVIRQEIGKKWARISALSCIILAYFLAFLTCNIARIFM